MKPICKLHALTAALVVAALTSALHADETHVAITTAVAEIDADSADEGHAFSGEVMTTAEGGFQIKQSENGIIIGSVVLDATGEIIEGSLEGIGGILLNGDNLNAVETKVIKQQLEENQKLLEEAALSVANAKTEEEKAEAVKKLEQLTKWEVELKKNMKTFSGITIGSAPIDISKATHEVLKALGITEEQAKVIVIDTVNGLHIESHENDGDEAPNPAPSQTFERKDDSTIETADEE